ncbi:MAG: tRNA lysidine(34) synthetase TilS [Alphaproteobacteria bacterium]|nr:tRNA lysidine(34) synthetase TilS [Alphaproteobacteria bacterium]NCQ67366.1 tRNA lysidine(34) synthetase TilS [Alphaproteobacteria bacterium]NCT06668.1 tRNA lysidine(34) synthetase TilS [Alphaproteobacteria bacterium]
MSVKAVTAQEFESLLYKAGFCHSASPQNLKIAVAVSGGADSLALTFLLKEQIQKQRGELVALTVDHGLRPQSAQEAKNVQKLLKNHGIEHHILTWQGEKPLTAIQAKARDKRYDLLKTWCLEQGYEFLFLGHHQGDQSETYCMRLRQNSGLLGLACMRPLSKHRTLTLVRPFLEIPKDRLKKTLKQLQIEWVEDSGNQNRAFERVFWRQVLGNLTPSLELYQGVREAYEGWIVRYLEAHARLSDFGYVRLDQEAFAQLPETFQGSLVSYLLQAYGVGRYPLTSRSLKGLLDKIKTSDFSAVTAQGLKISKRKKELLMVREYRAITEETELSGRPFMWDSRFLVTPSQNLKGIIKCIGEKGWLQLLDINPALKNLDVPRAVLWSLPSLWVESGEKIHPTFKVIGKEPSKDCFYENKMFVFKSKRPF